MWWARPADTAAAPRVGRGAASAHFRRYALPWPAMGQPDGLPGATARAERARPLLRQTRLVTLTGPGGCGKTRLAVEMARPLLDEHQDAVWFVDLSTVTGQVLVVSAVAIHNKLGFGSPPQSLIGWQ